ncbi:phage tail tape measure protein [Pseudomonas sp. LTR0]|uniref:phage tail tape measure protein n=1 Tax=Pseudomonas sp. LTR0 TaxID=3040601 RepID=UPI0030D3F70E
MANDLRLRLLLDTVDKATAPLRQINKGGQETARALKATRDRLKELNAQQKDVGAWRQQNAQARETAKALDAARAKVKQMGREMSALDNPTKKMTAEFQAAIRATNELKQQQKDEQEALRGLQRRLGEAGIDTRKLNQHNAALRQQMTQTNHTIEQQEARLKQLAVAQRKAAQAKERLEKTQDHAGKMAGAGAAGIAAGAGMAVAGAAVLAPQLEVAHQGSRIAAQSGESTDQGKRYSDLIRNIRADGQSSDIAEIGDAVAAAKSTLGALGSLGDKELDSAARKALDLSKVMELDVAESIQMVGILMKNGLASSSDQAFDLVAAGLQKVSTQMRGEIPEILHEYSTHFRGMGFTGSEAMSLLINMAKQGKFALDKTGDAIKEFSIRGSDMSKTSQEAYASIGLNATKMSSAIAKGGPSAREALTKTANALLRIKDPAERANAAIALFGTPVEDLAIDQIPDFLKALAGGTAALGDITGAADKMGKTFRDNLSGDLDKLTGTWSGMIGALVDGQNGPLRELVQTVTGILGASHAWIEANPELASSLAKGAAVVAVLVAGMGALTVAMASILGPFALARYGMSMFAIQGGAMLPVVGKLVGALSGTLLTAIRGVSIALWGLATNPATLAIAAAVAAIAGAGYLLYQNWDPVKAYFSNSWAEIKAGFSGGISGILTVLANFSPIGLIYQAFAGVLNYLGVDMPARFTEFGGMIISGLVKGLTAGFGAVKDAISSIGTSTIGWFKEKLGIHSPSRVFTELGGFTTEGLAQGLERGSKEPLDAVAKLGQQLSQAGFYELRAATLQLDGARPEVSRPPVVQPLTVVASPASAPESTGERSHDASSLAAALVGMSRTLASGDDTKPDTPRRPVIQPLAVTVAPAAVAEPAQGSSPDASSLAVALVGMNRTLASGGDTKPDTPRPPVIQPLTVTVAPAAAAEPAQGPSSDASSLSAALVGMSRTLASGGDTKPDTPRPPVIQPLAVTVAPAAAAEPAQGPSSDASSLAAALVGMSRTLASGNDTKPETPRPPVIQPLAVTLAPAAATEPTQDPSSDASSLAAALVGMSRTLASGDDSKPETPRPPVIQPLAVTVATAAAAEPAHGPSPDASSVAAALIGMSRTLASGDDARPDTPRPPVIQPLAVAASPVVPAEPAPDPAPDTSSLTAALVGMSRTLANGAEAKPVIQLKPAVHIQAAATGGESATKESWFADSLSAFTEALALVNPFLPQTEAVKPGPTTLPAPRIEPRYPEEVATLPASLALGMTVGSKSLIGALTAMTLQLAHAGGVAPRPEIPQVPSVQAPSTGPLDSAPITLTVDNRPPIAAAPPVSYDSHDVYHISIPTAPGMDAKAIARAVSAELDKRDREKSARQRSRLTDLE